MQCVLIIETQSTHSVILPQITVLHESGAYPGGGAEGPRRRPLGPFLIFIDHDQS